MSHEAQSHTPADLHIESRNLKFQASDRAVRWWHGGDPIATAFFNALSALFPQGERFFIDSVKRYRTLANPKLEKQIATFITQEALHTREHLAFNRLASERGYDLSEIDRF
ncbi:MAG: metal-dependent hydrolase, partial [Alphaproteobacteria bacterium]|nr:metal-dependent hydrolase [Alphaproteobacteria bacterium]